MTRHDSVLKWIAYLVALAVITILNFNVLSFLPIPLPLLLPMAAVASGTLEGPKFGASYGIFVGVFMVSFSHSTLIAIPLMSLIGWICGLLAQYVFRRDVVGHLIFAAGLMFIWETVQVGYRLYLHMAEPALLFKTALPELWWTLIFSLPVYWVCRFCCVHYGRIYHE